MIVIDIVFCVPDRSRADGKYLPEIDAQRSCQPSMFVGDLACSFNPAVKRLAIVWR